MEREWKEEEIYDEYGEGLCLDTFMKDMRKLKKEYKNHRNFKIWATSNFGDLRLTVYAERLETDKEFEARKAYAAKKKDRLALEIAYKQKEIEDLQKELEEEDDKSN